MGAGESEVEDEEVVAFVQNIGDQGLQRIDQGGLQNITQSLQNQAPPQGGLQNITQSLQNQAQGGLQNIGPVLQTQAPPQGGLQKVGKVKQILKQAEGDVVEFVTPGEIFSDLGKLCKRLENVKEEKKGNKEKKEERKEERKRNKESKGNKEKKEGYQINNSYEISGFNLKMK